MISRGLISIFVALLLGGCGHIPRFSDKSAELPAPTPEPVSASAPATAGNPADTSTPSETTEAVVTTDELSEDNAVAVTEAAEQPEDDLLVRIRNGLSLPDFDSKYIADYERWNSQHPTYLRDLFTRAEPFLFYIVEELEARGMPLDLALLPAVESAYKPSAYSRSAASGLWQFIPSTGKHFGLRQDWWYDGRRDPLASTQAALDYLEELNAMFDGDWFLSLAAYNAGQGTVRRAIKRNKKKRKNTDYQSLKLRAETTRYVPKLFALRNILSNPEKYQVTLPKIANQPYFAVLDLPGQTDLQRFSNESGIGIGALRHLNAGHKRWATSPVGPHRILVPLVAQDRAKATLERLAKEPVLNYQHHTIRQGDTLSGISKRYGVPVSAIRQSNNMSNNRIRAGKSLMIPIAAKAGAQASSSANLAVQKQTSNKIVHTVSAGDTLWSIARRYRVKVAQLLNWNQLAANQILSLNQALTVFPN